MNGMSADRGGADLLDPDHRQRPGLPDSGAADFDLGRHGGDARRLRSQGFQPRQRCCRPDSGPAQGHRRRFRIAHHHGPHPGPAENSVLSARWGHRLAGLGTVSSRKRFRQKPSRNRMSSPLPKSQTRNSRLLCRWFYKPAKHSRRYVDLGTEAGQKFYDQLLNVRNGLYYELGVIFPSLQVKGHAPGEPGSYTIWANEVPGHQRADSPGCCADQRLRRQHFHLRLQGREHRESGDWQASRVDPARTGGAGASRRLSGLGHAGNSSTASGALPEEKREGIYRRSGSAVHGLIA